MTDARLPERWLNDRRVQRLPDRAFRSFVVSLMWSVANRTEGAVTDDDLSLIPRFHEDDADVLAAAELWARDEWEAGWLITDWEETQTARSDLELLDNGRRQDRDSKRRRRHHAKGDHQFCGADNCSDVPRTCPPDSPPGRVRGTPIGQGLGLGQASSSSTNGNPQVNGSGVSPGQSPGTPSTADRRAAEANALAAHYRERGE